MSGRHADFLELADWRRRVAELYAEVRRLAATEPAAALEHWRAVRERLYREHPQSPLPAVARATFRARHFPHDPALRFEVPLLPGESVTTGGKITILKQERKMWFFAGILQEGVQIVRDRLGITPVGVSF